MISDIPEEDKHLDRNGYKVTTTCVHEWCDSYVAGGLSRKSRDTSILVFFCKKCLEIRKKTIDSSDMLVSQDILEMYDNED